jgi:aryl-alcohol dehydrogenase-like predicted oxidoreductase
MSVRGTHGPGLASLGMGLGGCAFTGGYGPLDEEQIARTVLHAVDIGITMVDLADFYGGGRIERTVGPLLADRRDEVLIATRGGIQFDAAGRRIGVDGSPESLARACDASLRRLAVDHIDLYYLARIDARVPVEESVGRLAELARAGKIRYIGLADATAEQLRRAHAVHPIAALAREYSLLDRRVEAAELPAARALGVALVACRPLARGLLTGRISSSDTLAPDDCRRGTRTFQRDYVARSWEMLAPAQDFAAEKDLSLSRLALAWLLHQPGVVPVPSTRNALHLEMNAAAAEVRLTQEERERLAVLFPLTWADASPR